MPSLTQYDQGLVSLSSPLLQHHVFASYCQQHISTLVLDFH